MTETGETPRPSDGRTSAPLLARLAADRVLLAVIAATAVVSVVAVAFPGIDLAVSGLVHRPGVDPLSQFPLEHSPLLGTLRQAGMGVTRWIIVALVLAALAKAVLPMLARAIPTRPLLFLASSLTIGPGLVVNAFFKELWGRPRPVDIRNFGAEWTFMPAWVPGGACQSNCSFPSGEASSSMWLIALVFVVPPTWRRATLAAVLVWATLISANRIAFGGHFLSDVLIGWGMTTLVVLVCRHVVLDGLADETLARLERAFARAGAWTLGRLGCRDLGGAAERV